MKIKEKIYEEEKNKEVEASLETNEKLASSKKLNFQKAKSKILKYLNEVLNTRFFVLFLILLVLLKTLLLYKSVIYIHENLGFNYYIRAFVFIATLFTIPMFLKNKIRFFSALTINLILSFILFVNDLYYSYATNLISISQIINLQYGKEISAALPTLLHIRQILYFIDIIVFLVLFFIKKSSFNKCSKQELKNKKWKRIFSKHSYILGTVYLVVIIFISVSFTKNWLVDAQEYQYNKLMQIEKASVFGYHYLDIVNNLNMKKNVKYKTKDSMLQVYDGLKNDYNEKYSLQYDFKEIAKNKNVIIIQLESVQNFVLNRKINGQEITPNLNKFINDNIEFTNMQNQSYSSTSDSEYSVMNSLYPLENGMSFSLYSSNDYDDIYENFKSAGYITTYIHGNEGSFWNRNSVYSRLKIDDLLFDDVFPENVERINDYVSDEEVYRKIVSELKNYEENFFVNIVAASSHIAFDLPGLANKEEKVKLDVGEEYKGMLFGNYLEAMNYADYAFGIFIDELKKSGLYDDTVILVYGDHAGLQMYNYEMQDFINEATNLNDIKTQINYSNVLCGLKIPGVSSMKIEKPVSKLDIKPTLTEICGIEDEFSLGMSMFSNKDFVCLNNGRIITEKYFYDGTWYNISDGEQVDFENLSDEEIEKFKFYEDSLQKELDISLSINILNLLKK